MATFARLDVEEYPDFPGFALANEPSIVVPSFATGKIFSHYKYAEEFPDPGVWDDIINVHNASTGASLGFSFLVDICAISGNGLLCHPAFALGTDGYLYAITTNGVEAGGAWWEAAMVLSKIDQATMTEVATLVPYAVANSLNTYSQNAFQIATFALNGTNYAALFLTNNASNFVEWINLDTMTSVAQLEYSTSTFDVYPTVGDQPSATAQNIYYVRNETSNTDDPAIKKITFTEPSTIALANVVQYVTDSFDAGWGANCVGGPLMYDTADSTLVIFAGNVGSGVLQGTHPAYLAKVSKADGSIIWATGITNPPQQLMWAAGYSDLNGSLVYVPAQSPLVTGYTPAWTNPAGESAYLTFDLSDGSYVVAFSPYFNRCYTDDPDLAPGAQVTLFAAPFWSTAQQKLLYYVLNETNGGTFPFYSVSPVWGGGWAMFTLDVAADPCQNFAGYTDEDLPAVELACDAEWPREDLQPRSVGIFPVHATLGGGVALTQNEEAIENPVGFWRFALNDILIRSLLQVRKWRETQTLLNGRQGTCCVHIYDGKRAPWLTPGVPIVASAASAFAVNATSGSIQITSGGVPEPGQHFSAGERLYRLLTVGAVSSGDTYAVTIWPEVRTAIALDDPLEFTHPICRCRLETDDGMAVNLELLRYATPSVNFVEDI